MDGPLDLEFGRVAVAGEAFLDLGRGDVSHVDVGLLGGEQ